MRTFFSRAGAQDFGPALGLSIALHLALLGGLHFYGGRWPLNNKPASFEIDLSLPYRLSSNPAGARNVKRGDGRPTVIRSSPAVELPKEALPSLTGTNKVEPRLEDGGTPLSAPASNGELAGGSGGEEADLPSLTRVPRLLNERALARYLRELYPDAERRAHREGDVTLDIHLDAEGKATRVEIVQADDQDFAQAANAVVQRMKFLPALAGRTPVAVKVRQKISFRLES